ncbi:hypothetical protein TASIC1_0004057800 [Trichoderma asperellum]|uniref:Uncharacterized protein n=1 Tax=Trichoderma asperellum TaxID=101201 RepID=A0A6V8QX01_TRIAP|nr:hypothetical protein TASIC1_0004057800 [Trichoderma asperellum]
MHFSTAASLVLSLAAIAAAQLSAVPIIKQIAPGAENCADTTECRTAEQAAPFIAKSMSDYKIYNVAEMAAIISLMAFESVDFKFKHNVSPGRPGQGTANMQMANFNLLYAQSIDSVKSKVSKFTTTDGLSPDDLNHILSLVQPDEFNFASGAWFYSTHCDASVKAALQANPDDGFKKYITTCVGTSVTDERLAYFTRAKKAFGLN